MRRCEQEGVHYLFKLRLTGGVRRLLEKAMAPATGRRPVRAGGAGRRNCACKWSRQRQVIFLRRPSSSKTSAKLRSSRLPPNAGRILSQALVKYLHGRQLRQPLGYRPDESTIPDCRAPEPTKVTTSEPPNLG
jgi:hypothetical protein